MDRFRAWCLVAVTVLTSAAMAAGLPSATDSRDEALALLKNRCVRCHGPAKQDGGLNLAVPPGIVRGGKSGAAVVRGSAHRSLLWKRVAQNQMPPGEPLSAADKATLRRWLQEGAPGLPQRVTAKAEGDEHWASQRLRTVPLPAVKDAARGRTPIDRFVQSALEARGLTLNPEAPRDILIRRVSFNLTGLPPTPDELARFSRECDAELAAAKPSPTTARMAAPKAYAAMVDRYLASPRYGERWGKHWLDAAGYADSNGYFNADTDRPLAFRYRDYVVRSVNADKPWNRFIQEQLAGDELVGYHAGADIRPEMVEALEGTHFLRNSQDGTDSSDGNPDERRADKYAVLEGTQQIIGSALLGTTVQCARCHDHKFEPFSQRDYYALQAVIYPAFNVEKWVEPGKRVMEAASAAELAVWEKAKSEIDAQVAAKRKEWTDWARENREPSQVVFQASFDEPGELLAKDWTNTVPGDSRPAGTPPVNVDSAMAPGAQIVNGRLRIRESGSAGDRALSTKAVYQWAPSRKGAWIQATFDLSTEGDAAPYVGYFLALRDFAGTSAGAGGNVLIDGAAAGQATVYVGYPARSVGKGKIGRNGYRPGRNYGVRVTNLGGDKFEVAQMVDGVPDEETVRLSAADLPPGGFGFEYCCGRSFTVDNVLIEVGAAESNAPAQARIETYRKRRAEYQAAVRALEAKRPERPGKLAAVTDLSAEPPNVPLLERGEYKLPGENVSAAAPASLSEPMNPSGLTGRAPEVRRTTGRRLGFARWITQPGSRAEARLARVTVNRWWLHHFGNGIVATPDNLGYSGALPSHPELLEYLAGRLIRSGWSAKAIHREIVLSVVYRQSSGPTPSAQRLDEDNRLLSRFPLRRLDAESVRDGMLAVSGELDLAIGGAYVPTARNGEGEVVVAEGSAGARRRSLYLQQRRTQVTGLLDTFDAPSIVFNCTFRSPTTVPLQSLSLLNSAFVRARSLALTRRLEQESGAEVSSRIRRCFELVRSRTPTAAELEGAQRFLAAQTSEYGSGLKAEEAAWTDFCQSLLASNEFLYVR